MKKQEQGFIFLVTLLIIGVISLLILVSMQHILLYHKAINQQEVQHQNFYQLESIVLHLAHKRLVAIDQVCIVHKDSANQVLQKLVHLKGCTLGGYQYLIEDLGEFPCFVVNIGSKKRATHHQRVSVVQLEEGIPKSLLQMRFIHVGGIVNCPINERFVSLGVSSWRYFPST